MLSVFNKKNKKNRTIKKIEFCILKKKFCDSKTGLTYQKKKSLIISNISKSSLNKFIKKYKIICYFILEREVINRVLQVYDIKTLV